MTFGAMARDEVEGKSTTFYRNNVGIDSIRQYEGNRSNTIQDNLLGKKY